MYFGSFQKARLIFIYAEEQKEKRTKVLLGVGREGEKNQFLLCCRKESKITLF